MKSKVYECIFTQPSTQQCTVMHSYAQQCTVMHSNAQSCTVRIFHLASMYSIRSPWHVKQVPNIAFSGILLLTDGKGLHNTSQLSYQVM